LVFIAKVTKGPPSADIRKENDVEKRASRLPALFENKETKMSRHNEMPPVPPANRSHKGTGDNTEVNKDTSKKKGEVNSAEQGDTANIKQNTTNAGFFKGRRVK
jgi:hypothetical protein